MVKRRNIQTKRHRGGMNPNKSYQYSIDKELDSLMNDSSILRRSPSSSINMKIEDLVLLDIFYLSILCMFYINFQKYNWQKKVLSFYCRFRRPFCPSLSLHPALSTCLLSHVSKYVPSCSVAQPKMA